VSISARVISRLDELARQNDNRAAAVSASRAILQREEEAEARPQARQMAPGFVIVITPHQPPAPITIDAENEVDGERGG
jgi:predicted RecB family nuclease